MTVAAQMRLDYLAVKLVDYSKTAIKAGANRHRVEAKLQDCFEREIELLLPLERWEKRKP